MDENSVVMPRKRKGISLSQLSQTNGVAFNSKKKRTSDDTQRRAGTISRMILKNFMCHSMLDVDLNTINIVIGRNGSGKSAILTALIVGLGGKASLTNRGTSVKGFIKAGKTSGSVEIQIYNGGPMGYRQSKYGDKITILRNFTSSGSGSYKIKNENGEIISTSVKEIHNITTSLNIQVDNPVCILNQDTSRNFLSSSDPKRKFTLFMKATKLETLSDEYKTIHLNRRESVRLFEEKQTNCRLLQDELRSLKKKIDNHRSIVGIRDKIKLSQVELIWAKVRDAEEEVRKEEENVDKWNQKHESALHECATRSERIKSIKENISVLTQQIAELKDTIQVQSRPQADVRKTIEELRGKYDGKRRERQLLSSAIETKTKDANILNNEIQNANENMTRVEQEKIQRLRELNSMNEKIKGMEEHLQTCRNDLYQIISDVSRRDEEKQRLRREINQLEHQIGNEKSSLNALSRESGNTLLLYGQDIPKVKKLIEQNKHKFKHLPRGPLGSYIKLKDKKWAVAIESFITPGLLGAFVVDNNSDNHALLQILNKVNGRKPMVITSKFFYEKHNVQPNLVKAPKDCVSLYDALEIEDPVVSNCIVDQTGMEGILLIPSNDRAMELLSHAVNVPRNCRQGVTVGGDKYYPDPNYKTYGSRYHRAQYLQVDTKEHIVQLEQNIQELTEKKQGLENQYSGICREIRDQETKKNQLEEKIKKLNAARGQIRVQLDELKATAEPEVANVELLETELAEIRTTLQQKKAQMAQVEQELKEIRASLKENDEKLQKLKSSNSSLEDRMRNLEGQVQEEQTRQKEIATRDEFDKRKVKELEKRLSEARGQVATKQTAVGNYTQQATSLGERPETLRKVHDIATEITNLEKSVRKIEVTTENTDELVDKYQQMQEKFTKISALLNCLNNDIRELNTAIDKRSRHYQLTENFFITFIKHSFNKIMEVRQFQGSVDIDMQSKKLDLVVVPQHGSQGSTTTANLSGGERSFSTVAFLYALWQCMEFPFYFLDEFDVYMDKLNRTKVLDILIHHAETHPELQFVFLTPQDVSFVKKNVTILRLQDPERNPV